jgi:hypothetical protein
MAKVIVNGPDLVVRLSPLEKLGAFHRDVRVPLRTVRSAQAEPHPWQAIRGVRLAGTGIPGVAVLGTRYFKSGRDFVALVTRRPAILVELTDEAPYEQLLVSVRDPDSTLAEIRGVTSA